MPLIFKRDEISKFKVKILVNVVNNLFLNNLETTRNKQLKPYLDKFGFKSVIPIKNHSIKASNIINIEAPQYDINNIPKSENSLETTYKECLKITRETYEDRPSIVFPIIFYSNYDSIEDNDNLIKNRILEIAIKTIHEDLSQTKKKVNVRLVINQDFLFIDMKPFNCLNTIDLNLKSKLPQIEECINSSKSFGMAVSSCSDMKELNNKSLYTQQSKTAKVKFNDSLLSEKANLSRDRFSDTMNRKSLTKENLFAIACALELTLNQFNYLIKHEGYALSELLTFDRIVKYCISKKKFNIIYINLILFNNNLKQFGE